MAKVIKCGELFCATEETILKNVVVIVKDNQIAAIQQGYQYTVEPDDTVIDLSDKFVMPGLIDTHVHLCFNGTPALAEINDPPELVSLNALKNAQMNLYSGFTTVRDEGYPTIEGCSILRNAIDAGIHFGPRIYSSGMYITPTAGHLDGRYPAETKGFNSFKPINIANGPEEVRTAARYMLKYGADQIKVLVTGGVLSPGNEPGEQNMSVEEIKAAVGVAKMHNKIVSAHAHGTAGIHAAAEAGVTCIEHCTLVDEETIGIMAEKGIQIVPTFIVLKVVAEEGTKAGIPDFAVRKSAALVPSHLANIKKAYDAGVRVVFGTDCGTPLTLHGKQAGEFELMAKAGISKYDVLFSATRYAAELLRWDDKIGTIETGKLADIIAVDHNPMDDFSVMKHVTFVMKDGVVFKQ